ncbi:MAG: M48 family metalloprotease [Pyrinomonadaceae bacterium]
MFTNNMLFSSFIRRFGRFGLLIVMLAFLFSLNTLGQDDKKKADEAKKQQDKAAKALADADKKQAKAERRYQKIRIFAQDKYNKDADFKDSVDDAYRGIRELHTRNAYEINMRPSNYKLVARDGEKVRFDHTLYDNPLAQDYVNRVGQSLIPANSNKLFAFKVLQNPVPEARALSTGTVYISTGYLSVIDNEAQLAYILAHEIAHIEFDHWFQDILVDYGTQPYIEKNEALKLFGKRLLGAIAGGMAQSGNFAVANVLKTYSINETFVWESVQEDEADIDAMKYMFGRNYDVTEIPKLYARMKQLTSDPRSQTGFIADPERILQRLSAFNTSSTQYSKAGSTAGAADLAATRDKKNSMTGARGIAKMLNETLAPEIKRKLEAGELLASSEKFQSVMAMVKRDNGIRAFQFDIFEMARNNLKDSIDIRGNDPSAYYYYGKVLKQTARNASEMSAALANLKQSIQLDKRQTIAEPYLFRALLRLVERNPNEAAMIANDLRTYVTIYQRENAGALPTNIEFIYDIMQDFEVFDYRAIPAMNTTDAQKPVYGTQLTGGQQSSQPLAENPLVITPTSIPLKEVGKPVKGKKP